MRYFTGKGKYQNELVKLMKIEVTGKKDKFTILGNLLRILNNLYYDLNVCHLDNIDQAVIISAEDMEFMYRMQPTFVNLGQGDAYSTLLELFYEIFYNNDIGFDLNIPGNATSLIDDVFDIIVPHTRNQINIANTKNHRYGQ